MGLRVNNNIAAFNSYRNLQATDKSLNSSLEKLSSGYRINKAADDAAGLVVSEGLRSQIGGMTVAARNAQDGVNVAQTADGALSEVSSMLQRMRDLAVQASNTGTADTNARTAADTEFQALKAEIDRIGTSTKFGGQKLLDGSYGVKPAQLSGVTAGAISNTAAGSFLLTITGQAAVTVNVGAASSVTGTTYAATLQSAIRAALSAGTSANQAMANNVTVSSTAVGAGYGLTITVAGQTAGNGFAISAETQNVLTGAGITGTAATNASGTGGTFQIGANAADSLTIGINAVSTSALTLSTDLLSGATANAAITSIDTAIATIASQRATLGSFQNRFEHTINNLNVSIENITASESAIRDTDMAAEMSKFTRSQILSQAGTSMLAQANSSSQNILTLLRG